MKMLSVAAAIVVALSAAADNGRIVGNDKLDPEAIDAAPLAERAPGSVREGESGDRDRDEDARDLVETVMMVRMSEELNLSDEQTVMMVRRLRALKEEMIGMRRQRWALYRELKDALREASDDAAVAATLTALLEYDRQLETFKQDRLEALSEGLTEAQRAKLYIFLCEFENDMRHLVHRAQGRDWRSRNDARDEGDAREERDWRERWRDGDASNAPASDEGGSH